MYWDQKILSHLQGKSFSSCLHVNLRIKRHPWSGKLNRLEWLSKYVQDRKVLHVGCADHLPQIKRKRAQGRWLHDALTNASNICIGIDINSEAVEFVQSLGVQNVLCADLTQDSVPEIEKQTWDIAVLGELIEHLDDPIGFLKALRANIGRRVNEIVITTPNAFSLACFRSLLKGKEIINSDHRFLFSPYTLSKVIVLAGWIPKDLAYTRHESKRSRANWLWKAVPRLCDDLIVTAEKA